MSIQEGTTLFVPRLLRDIRLTLATPEHVWKLCKICKKAQIMFRGVARNSFWVGIIFTAPHCSPIY